MSRKCAIGASLDTTALFLLEGECVSCDGKDCMAVRRLKAKLQEVLPLAEYCQTESKMLSCSACLSRIVSGKCTLAQAQGCGCSFFKAVGLVAEKGETVFEKETVVSEFVFVSDEQEHSPVKVEQVRLKVWPQDPERTVQPKPVADCLVETVSRTIDPDEESTGRLSNEFLNRSRSNQRSSEAMSPEKRQAMSAKLSALRQNRRPLAPVSVVSGIDAARSADPIQLPVSYASGFIIS
jgi:hypothetical protein